MKSKIQVWELSSRREAGRAKQTYLWYIFAAVLTAFLLTAVVSAANKVVSDDQIYDQVKRKLASDPVVKGGALEVNVKQGVVTLSGMVESEKQHAKAERLAKKVSGVKQVINELKVVRKSER